MFFRCPKLVTSVASFTKSSGRSSFFPVSKSVTSVASFTGRLFFFVAFPGSKSVTSVASFTGRSSFIAAHPGASGTRNASVMAQICSGRSSFSGALGGRMPSVMAHICSGRSCPGLFAGWPPLFSHEKSVLPLVVSHKRLPSLLCTVAVLPSVMAPKESPVSLVSHKLPGGRVFSLSKIGHQCR